MPETLNYISRISQLKFHLRHELTKQGSLTQATQSPIDNVGIITWAIPSGVGVQAGYMEHSKTPYTKEGELW